MILGQYVYCHAPWSLVVQNVEHLFTYYAKSLINTKAVYVLLECPQLISATSDL